MEEEPKKNPIHALRTYQGDVEEAMSKSNTSKADIFLAEQKRKDSTILEPERKINNEARNKFFIIIGSILLLLGILTVGSVYYIQSNKKVVLDQQTRALIGFTEEKIMQVSGSPREQLLSNLNTEKLSFKQPVNSVLYINTVDTGGLPADIQSILQLITPNIPDSFIRSLDTKYMIGVYSFDTNEPFIILKIADYPSAFAGMLKWEKYAVSDIGQLFNIQRSTTTPEFIDEAFRNEDLRVLKSASNKTILLYSFIDKNTLVITKNENIFTAIVSKYLVSGQTQ